MIDRFVFPPLRPWFVLALAHLTLWVWCAVAVTR